MARERSSGAGASIIGMMVFGFLFFIAMVLAIIFYTKVADAERRAEEATTTLAKVATQSEIQQKDIAAIVGAYDKDRKTVVARLKADADRLRSMLSAGSTVEDIARRLEQLSIDKNRGIIPAYSELLQSKTTNDDLVESLKKEADDL